MIKALIFDFFGVIYTDEYWQFVGADKQSNNIYKDYADATNLGRMPWQVFINKIAESTDKTVQEVQQLYAGERIDQAMISLITELKGTYKIALLTNAHHEFIEEIITTQHLNTLFDVRIISSREGYIKPDARLYKLALDKLGMSPEEVLFIDDVKRNVEAARNIGMQAFVFEDFQQCKHKIEAILSTV